MDGPIDDAAAIERVIAETGLTGAGATRADRTRGSAFDAAETIAARIRSSP
jgi:hypothetical protein